MVQRKALTKPSLISFKASPSHEEIKKPSTNMKPYIQSLDSKAKGTELAKKMKKSCSFKRSSDLDTLKRPSSRRHQPPKQQTPSSLVKVSPSRSCSSSSPNYMKSTSSSEARKEHKTLAKSVVDSTSKRLFASPCRTSSLSKVRNLTKAPSFKPSRSMISKKCSKLDVKRNTCSSTIKDSKFPSYLDLSPGSTQSEGTSIMKVCPYNYCSLNGHQHALAPPLKNFLSTRRRMIKSQRNCKVKPCLDDDQEKEEVHVADKLAPISFNEEKADFFVEIYTKEGEEKEIGEEALDECVYDVGSFDWESSTSITLDEVFAEGFDMEWEEESRVYLRGFELGDGVSIPSDHESDHTKGNEIVYLQDEEGFKKDDVNLEFLKEFLAECSHDEIIDFHEQLTDSDSSMDYVYEETEVDQFFQGDFEEKITEDIPTEFSVPDEADEDSSLIQDIENSGFTKKVTRDAEEEQDEANPKKLLLVESSNKTIQATEEEEQEEVTTSVLEDQSNADNKPGNVIKNNFKKERTGGELSGYPDSSLIITKGRRSGGDENEETKQFNPREPNYLEVEPDVESEKVDLRHQEMDGRRNSEEWMVDYALRKAVSELAPARKRKVALLVAAFETVIPTPSRIQACN